MNIQYRLGIEQKAAACRSEVLALIEDYLGDTGVHGEPFLAMILSLDGVTVPANAGPLEIFGPVEAPALALPTPQDDGDLTDDDVAELEQMVAGPKPAVKPAPGPAAATRPIDRPTVKDKPLSDAEIAEVLERDARGEGSGAIAAAVGRDPRGFYHTVNALRAAAEAEAEEAEDEPDPPAEELAPKGPFIFEPDPAAPLKDRSLHALLNALGYPDPWTPETDWRMAEIIGRGDGVAAVVDILGIERQAILKRWRDMMPPDRTLADQERLMTALRARAAAYVAEQGGGA